MDEMNFEDLCDNAVFDTDLNYSDTITDIAMEMLGASDDDDDFEL